MCKEPVTETQQGLSNQATISTRWSSRRRPHEQLTDVTLKRLQNSAHDKNFIAIIEDSGGLRKVSKLPIKKRRSPIVNNGREMKLGG
jgi:hypothetical protein